MAMFGMDNEKKTLLVQEVYRRPLIWKVSLCHILVASFVECVASEICGVFICSILIASKNIDRDYFFFQVTDPRYSDIPARWLAFEEIAHELSDEDLVFTS